MPFAVGLALARVRARARFDAAIAPYLSEILRGLVIRDGVAPEWKERVNAAITARTRRRNFIFSLSFFRRLAFPSPADTFCAPPFFSDQPRRNFIPIFRLAPFSSVPLIFVFRINRPAIDERARISFFGRFERVACFANWKL